MNSIYTKVLFAFLFVVLIFGKTRADDVFFSNEKGEYNTYCNQRFGFCVDYLKTFKIDIPPDNGDGQRFYHGDNFEMVASGMLNVFNESLKDVMQDRIACYNGYQPDVTYRFVDKNFFVASGFCGKTIFYTKVYVGKESVNTLYLTYPKNEKSIYNNVVTRLSNSFKPGKLN